MRTMTVRTTGLIVMLLLVGGCSLERLQTESAALRHEAEVLIADVEASGILNPPASARLEWIDTRMAEIDDKIQGAETGFDIVDMVGGLAAGAFGLGVPWALFSTVARRKLASATWGKDQALDLAKGRQIEAARSRQAIVAVVRSIDDAKAASEDVRIIALDRDKLALSQIAHRVTDIVTAAREGVEWKVDEAINTANE